MKTFIQRTTSHEAWETPRDLFDKLDAEFGFTLDVAANDKNAKCNMWYTKEDNALEKAWAPHVCWMNPPYGREIGVWVEKAYRESLLGATVVCLIPARTDAAWFHDYAQRGEVRFIRRRVRFVGAPYNAPFPSMLVIFRPQGVLNFTGAGMRGEE